MDLFEMDGHPDDAEPELRNLFIADEDPDLRVYSDFLVGCRTEVCLPTARGRSTMKVAPFSSSESSHSTTSSPSPAAMASAVSRHEVSLAIARCGCEVEKEARAASIRS